jgi:hypothetical protein
MAKTVKPSVATPVEAMDNSVEIPLFVTSGHGARV